MERRRVTLSDVEDQQAPSRSAVVSIRASLGRQRHWRAPGSGPNEGWRSAVSPGAVEGRDSYRCAALSHESRNLRKSARVSLSAASCARAAHSAAFCRQYSIFCHMTVPPLELPRSRAPPGGSLESELAERSIVLSREEGFRFQRVGVGKAKHAHA